MANTLSQELFDETVLENQDVFDLSPEQALQETLSQYSMYNLALLVKTHPDDSCGKNERRQRQEFVAALDRLDQCVNEDGTVCVVDKEDEAIRKCFNNIETCVSNDNSDKSAYLALLQQHDGMYTLMNFLINVNDRHHNVLQQTIRSLIAILTPTDKKNSRQVQSQLRSLLKTTLKGGTWMTLYRQASCESNSDDNAEMQSLLLQLAYVSCRFCEENKKAWMQAASSSGGVQLVLDTFEKPNVPTQVLIHASQLITTLCKFDDFSSSSSTDGGPVVSSAHNHVLEFAKHGAVPILYKTATTADSTELLAAVLSALRVLSIQDDIVQSMVALGALDFSAQLLEEHMDNSIIIAATLGWIRNLCANDMVKTTLCGKDAVLQGILNGMEKFPHNGTIQEHACGVVAAMALRNPANAVRIVQEYEGHFYIIKAMQLHATNTLIQRQGALALRNLASRSPEVIPVLLDAGAESVLRSAGTHQACVDEAYAALRDLGCEVEMVKVNADGSTSERTRMFGESAANFRPVFETSNQLLD